MDKNVLKKLDQEAIKETNNLIENIIDKNGSPKKGVSPKDLFGKTTAKFIEDGSLSLLHGIEMLPVVLPFYKKIIIDFCSLCARDVDLNQLEIYLERNLVMPSLRSAYATYPTNFIKLISNFPHINVYNLKTYSNFLGREYGNLCLHCEKKILNRVIKKIPEGDELLKTGAQSCLLDLLNTGCVELIPELESALSSRNKDKILTLHSVSQVLSDFQNGRIFNATPQFNFSEQRIIKEAMQKTPNLSKNFGFVDLEEALLDGIKVPYSRGMDLELYLDFIEKKRKKITQLVSDFKSKGDLEDLLNLKKDFQEINLEIHEIANSQRGKIYTLATDFLAGNKANFVAAVLSFAGLSLSGMGAFSLLGPPGAMLAVASLKKSVKIPESWTEAFKNSKEPLDPFLERVLASYFCKKPVVIQTWLLRKEFENLKKLR